MENEATTKAHKLPRKACLLVVLVMGLIGLAGLYLLGRTYLGGRNKMVIDYIRNPERHPEFEADALTRCGDAPFLLPSKGFIGYLWGDSFKPFHRHQGIDIFGGTEPGKTPVYAPYDGFLTREESWRSSLIIRIPQDPLDPSRQIWLYMTHLADAEGNSFIESAFPPGTYDKPIYAGDLLGFQGDYSGDPDRPVGVHLHFSIVMDDGSGNYLNELEIRNTLDPTPYFGFELNAKVQDMSEIPRCDP
ncbi:MAG TPA: M23 family metallopeptidase [Anaerolineaceae bacterium]|nr:M23 family metallopeptidase [Anaerolineaceae bacterium]